MSTIEDLTNSRIAQRIRLEREARGWSLSDMAGHSGVSKATISKIEREEVSPSAAILVRLAGAFDLTLAGLLIRAEGEGERLSRAADQSVWRDPETGYLRTQIFARPDHPLEIASVELPAGTRLVFPASSYARIRQLIWISAGELAVTEHGERYVLQTGDCLAFGPPCETALANETVDPCRYLVLLVRH